MAAGPHIGKGRATRASGKGGVRRGVRGGSSPSARGQVSEMQRARLLGAAVPVVDELGWSEVTVADIASRARVSRRTFYDLFSNREECLLAVLHDTVQRVVGELSRAGLDEDCSWVERVRTGVRRGDSLREVPMRLTYRTARVLQAVGAHSGGSNRQIGEHADLYDQGQMSKLLARLERLGLLENSGEGQARGESNAWKLTGLGERVTEQFSLGDASYGDGV
jgi:AcrR family transcriptional regulator